MSQADTKGYQQVTHQFQHELNKLTLQYNKLFEIGSTIDTSKIGGSDQRRSKTKLKYFKKPKKK